MVHVLYPAQAIPHFSRVSCRLNDRCMMASDVCRMIQCEL